MNPTIEFLMNQHEHVLESIKLADQKAAAIIAISVGTIYLLYELIKAPCFAPWPWKCAGGLAQIFLLLSTGAALWTIAPPTNRAYRDVEGGTHTIPDRAAALTQVDYEQWAVGATADEREKEVATLVYARMKSRAWKYIRVRWAIRIMYFAFALLFLLVGAFVVHTVRTRQTLQHAFMPNNSGGTPVESGPQTSPAQSATSETGLASAV